MHPDGRISRKSFHTMMKECYPGADTEKLERHIFRMYDSNKVSHGHVTGTMADQRPIIVNKIPTTEFQNIYTF